MKYSIYNSIIQLTDKSSLLYNAFSDTFIVFDCSYKDLILNNIENLEKKNTGLYNQIINSQCYVPDTLDEFSRLLDHTTKIIQNENQFFLILNPTLSCNFKCWYCYEDHIKGSNMSDQVIQSIDLLYNKILEENPNIKTFTLSFFGGEPLMRFKSIVQPRIKKHIDFCKKNELSYNFSFTSNGSLISKKMILELKKYGDISFQITLDGNEELHNKVRFFTNNKGSYKIIVKNIKLLLENNIEVRLRINYTRENYLSIIDILEDLKEISLDQRRNFEIDFHRVWQDKEGMKTLNGIHKVLNSFVNGGFKIIFADLNEINNACYADKKNTLVINYNGDIYKCTAKDFSRENREGYLESSGNIIWEKSQEHRQHLKLTNKRCHTCRIAPLCGGGCTRYILEREGSDYCLFNKMDDLIDKQILYRFDSAIRGKKIL